MAKEKILVTGATGFLGMHIVKTLISDGWQVCGLVQAGQDTGLLDELGVSYFIGDLLNKADLDKAIATCKIIVHTAAITDILPGRSKKLFTVNYEGTRNLVSLAIKHRVKRFIHVGTANSFGYGSKENPGDEKTSSGNAKYKLDYIDSKLAAQEFILQQVKVNGFPALIVNPTFMLGPGGVNSGSNQLIINVCRRKKLIYPRGGRNYVPVKDVARGIANAIEMGRIGECYILGNINLSYKEIFKLIAETADIKLGLYPVPPIVLKASGIAAQFIAKLNGKKPEFSYALARMSCDENYYSAQKAIRELNMPQNSLQEAIKEAIEWNRSKKLF